MKKVLEKGRALEAGIPEKSLSRAYTKVNYSGRIEEGTSLETRRQ